MQGIRCGWPVLLFFFTLHAQTPAPPANTGPTASAVAAIQVAPGADQHVKQPAGTSFVIDNNGVASVAFTDPLSYQLQNLSPGVLSQERITGYKPSIFQYNLWTPNMTCAGPSQDLSGNWSQCNLISYKLIDTQRGIGQRSSGFMASYGIGDRALDYDYATFFGGVQVFNDEGITLHTTHAVQNGFLIGPVTEGGTNVPVIRAKVACRSAGGESCMYTLGNYFNDGGILYNQSQGRSAKIVSAGNAMHGLYFDVSGISLPQSTAWGNIVSCTNNGDGRFQKYTSTTCKIKLGTDPASPGSFVAEQDIYLSGPFEEEVYVIAAPPPSRGIQEITFNTRYYWNQGVPTIVMQGGPGGEAIVQNPSWPIAWFVVGAFSKSRLVYSNCHLGYCNNANVSGIAPHPTAVDSFQSTGQIIRKGNVVTFTYSANNTDVGSIYQYPTGSTVVLSGWSPSDLNGTYAVTYGSMDSGSPSIQWAQTGADETSTVSGKISQPLSEISLYPSAFIIGTDGGNVGVAQLGKNRVNFGSKPSGAWTANTSYAVGYTLMDPSGHAQIVTKAGVSGAAVPTWRNVAGPVNDNEVVWSFAGNDGPDIVVGAPTSEYQQVGFQYYATQATPSDSYSASRGISIIDSGPSHMTNQYEAINDTKNGIGANMFRISGSFKNIFNMQYRPANNGSIIYVAGQEPVSANRKPYYLFVDNQTFASILVRPAVGGFGIHGGLSVDGGSLHLDNRHGAGLYLDGLAPGTGALCLNGPGGQITNVGCGSGVVHSSNVVVQAASGTAGNAIEVQNHDGKVVADLDAAGNVGGVNGTFVGTVRSGQYIGPVKAPSGSCTTNGAWVFSQDGHATFCASGKWVTKI